MKFSEVFPTIDYNNKPGKSFGDLEVEKLSTSSDKSIIRVHIISNSLLPKQIIYDMEAALKKQLSLSEKTNIYIKERFLLSESYTPENLYELYNDSIKLELKTVSPVLYSLYNCADINFDGDKINVHVIDSTVAQKKSDELEEILHQIFDVRCGLNTQIAIYTDKIDEGKEKRAKDSELITASKVRSILENVSAKSKDTSMDLVLASASSSEKQEKIEQNNTSANKSSNSTKGEDKKFAKTFEKKAWDKKNFTKREYKSDNPDVIYGREISPDEPITELSVVNGEIGTVVVRGMILSTETRALRNGEKSIISFVITDFTDSISSKIFVKNEDVESMCESIKKGAFIKIKGVAIMDTFEKDIVINSLTGMMKIPGFSAGKKREDNAPQKRVELHCHSKFSDMDGVSEIGDILKQAAKFGHRALAITDHGNIQAFTEAFHKIGKLPKLEDGSELKVIYGVEGYLINDEETVVIDSKNQPVDSEYVVFDLETTGLSPKSCRIIEIGAVKVKSGKIIDRYSTFVNPERPIPYRIEELTSIRDDMVKDAPVIEQALPEFLEFAKGCVLVGHNVTFDTGFISSECKRLHLPYNFTSVDTMVLARILLPKLKKHTLDAVAKELGCLLDHHHRAVDDAECTALIFNKLLPRLDTYDIKTLDDIDIKLRPDDATISRYHPYHVIILAKNEIGRVNLYKLVSLSHLTYFNKRPKIPKTILQEYREGLIIGSACEAGELYSAIELGRPEEEIAHIVNFYDYLEIQPVGNNFFKLRDDKSPINTIEDLQNINKEIVSLGETFNKPVVATCDVHYLNPEDAIYRTFIQAGNGYDDADDQPPLYLHTTEEMLEELSYLDYDKAYEIVVTNPNKIADMVDRIIPVRPDKAPPVIENSDQDLRNICYEKAHEIYGPNLPKQVEERLEKELNSIIGNGYAVMYIIAQKLVWKSNEDGYLVGSRGSVGSSFAATMSGITEVNPLSPHYLCGECYWVDFDSPEVLEFSGRGGCDMPDRNCPKCGAKLQKLGFDIPFETFLGFKGDKEPDIDLNFSGEYQAKAHKYTEVIFGKGQTFKAGTIGTLADKTAFGYIKKYYEEKNINKRKCEIDRLVPGITGIRRTTGQHPGGIVVLPKGENMYSFTPIQHPANDMTSDIITTHFDYHSIDHNLLKLDILGHDDPTMIRRLEDLTGMDAKTIPLDAPEVMSLFRDLSALEIKPEDIGGCKLGALGIPEFGTDFAMQMLIDTEPKEFSDLVRIAGLSHGTDVWLGNAQDLILSKTATISECICTRDDIMTYLIHMGVEPADAFSIMENVRKGKVAKKGCDKWPKWREDILAHNVPEWYVESCEKIQYMFPKAHAVAYVMMAWRIAYFKIHYPLAYYAAYFSIRAKAFKYELMCLGKERLNYYITDFRKRADDKEHPLSNSEADSLSDMKLVEEMYARGYEFMPIDIYRAKANDFQIIDGKIMPALSTLDGMGGGAALTAEQAAKDGPFLSREDYKNRAKVSQKVIDNMNDLGLFGNLPETNQISIFDFLG